MHSPFKTIFRKEWKQTAVLRRVALILMVLLPPFVILAADSASRGWIPMFFVSSYDTTQLFMDAVPMILVLAWMFFAALFTAQTFAGDRSTGNESFLLERPVARTVTWIARLVATLANGLTVVLSGWLIWLVYFLSMGDPPEGKVASLSGLLLGVGLAIILTVICGGLAATAFLELPMIAVLGGLLMAALPAGAAVLLGGMSPFAVLFRLGPDTFPSPLITLSRLPVGMVLPVLLYPAYVFVSWLALCRGEPAGRGSRSRGAKVLGPSILGVLILFLLLAPLAVRANVNAGLGNGQIYPSPATGRCVIVGGHMASGGWLLDTETGEKLRFFGPLTDTVVWSPDGSRVAAATYGRSIQWIGDWDQQVEVVDSGSGSVQATYELLPGLFVRNLTWIGNSLLVTAIDFDALKRLKKTDRAGEAIRFILLQPAGKQGDQFALELDHDLPLPGIAWSRWQIISSGGGSDEFLIAITQSPVMLDHQNAMYLERDLVGNLYRVHVEGNALHSSKARDVPGGMSGGSNSLSRSGRHWWTLVRKNEGEEVRGMRLFDLDTGLEIDLGDSVEVVWPVWLDGDELIWVQRDADGTRLSSWKSETGKTVVFENPGTDRMVLDASPDGRTVLITGYKKPEDPGAGTGTAKRTGSWLYEAGSGKVAPFETEYEGYVRSRFWTNWADPDTVLRTSDDGMYFESVREPGKTVEID